MAKSGFLTQKKWHIAKTMLSAKNVKNLSFLLKNMKISSILLKNHIIFEEIDKFLSDFIFFNKIFAKILKKN